MAKGITPSLNTRQQLYKKYRLEGYSKYTAARKAGYSHAYAKQAKAIDNSINMRYWLEKEGLTDTCLANHAKQGMAATNKDNMPDWSARHKYFETVLKMFGKLTAITVDVQHTHITFIKQFLSKTEEISEGRILQGTNISSDGESSK